MSDGLEDQHGGPENKKFSSSQFKELITGISDKDCNSQKEAIEGAILNWMKDTHQRDDILVIGFKVSPV